jgi:hypothetical protein
MSIRTCSVAIALRWEDGEDKILYTKEFKPEQECNDDDIDLDLFHEVLNFGNDEDTVEQKESNTAVTSSSSESFYECSIKQQFLLQSALDKMNHDIKFEKQLRTTFNRQFSGIEYMWLGLICPLDEYRFYGYITNTNVKIIISVEDDIFPEQQDQQKMREDEIQTILVRSCYS